MKLSAQICGITSELEQVFIAKLAKMDSAVHQRYQTFELFRHFLCRFVGMKQSWLRELGYTIISCLFPESNMV